MLPSVASWGWGILFGNCDRGRQLVLFGEAFGILLHFHGFEAVDLFDAASWHGKVVMDSTGCEVLGEAVKCLFGIIKLGFGSDKDVASVILSMLGWFNTGEEGHSLIVSNTGKEVGKCVLFTILGNHCIQGSHSSDGDSDGILHEGVMFFKCHMEGTNSHHSSFDVGDKVTGGIWVSLGYQFKEKWIHKGACNFVTCSVNHFGVNMDFNHFDVGAHIILDKRLVYRN